MLGIVIGCIGSVAAVAAYFDRKNLKADVARMEGQILSRTETLAASLKAREASVRKQVTADLAKVVSDVRVWAVKEKQEAEAVLDFLEARIKQVL